MTYARRSADADRVVFIKNYTDPVCSETVLEEQRARSMPTWFDLTTTASKARRASIYTA